MSDNYDDTIISDEEMNEIIEEHLDNHPGTSQIVPVSDILPETLTILPVSPRPYFPGMMLPLTFTGSRFLETLNDAYEKENRVLGLVMVKNEHKGDYFKSELYQVGTVIKIYKIIPINANTVQVLAQGIQRFSYKSTISSEPVIKWKVDYHPNRDKKPDDELKAYMLSIMNSLKELLNLNPVFKEQLTMLLTQSLTGKPGLFMDLVSSMINADADKLQDLLETIDLYKRSEKLLILVKEEIEISQIQEKIQKQISEKIDKQQKDFFLREQLKAIKMELGLEKDDKTSEIEKIQDKIKNLKLSEEATKVIHEELDKLRLLDGSSPEFNVTRSYLAALTDLPWGIFSKDRMSIKKARKVLDDEHFGLADVKQTILEFLSTIIKRGKVGGSIICLVGPPGVGKTSIGRSIAHALNRKFFRFSVGGMNDEAEIKGHRRTYIGAMPGKILQALKLTGTANPVLMLDEIDKIGSSYKGDPASALLEVLDPEQNKEFLDHYLDVRFDLSNILFVTTANQLDTIPRPLLDRMEIIQLSGYILEEKVQIAKKYLIPKQMKEHGLSREEVTVTDKALVEIIDKYAREAGVRSLEKNIKKIMRHITLKQQEGEAEKFSITVKNVEKFLGKPVFTTEKLYKKSIPGVTLGLAWTSMGGATLYIEASAIKGKATGFKQTGQLGDVMKESSEIAYSFIRALLCCQSEELKNFFDEHLIHLHVPAGATPKDGPSAGITMALALYSLATGKAVKEGLAMTGEITLTGKVLPIGGVKEKTIAARRVGVYELIFPGENKKDFDELPSYIKKGIKAHFADYFEDVIKIAF